MPGLFVKRDGRGPRVVLLHGAVLAGELCWRQQLPLADCFALEIIDRAGYGRSQQVSPGEDLDADAPLVAEILADGAHLVGQSSGAVVAMMAAALRPQAVLSLTLCEPVAFQLAPRSAEAQQMARDIGKHLQQPGDDAEWLRGFLAIIGRDLVIPDQLPPPLAQGVRAIRAVRRRPWEGELPVEQLAATRFPKLVISGNHSPAFEAVCDALAARLQAQRAYVTGAGHATPDTGEAFNETLASFIGTSPRDHRAISVPLAPVKTGISQSLVDSQPRSSGHMRAPEGSDSQADSPSFAHGKRYVPLPVPRSAGRPWEPRREPHG